MRAGSLLWSCRDAPVLSRSSRGHVPRRARQESRAGGFRGLPYRLDDLIDAEAPRAGGVESPGRSSGLWRLRLGSPERDRVAGKTTHNGCSMRCSLARRGGPQGERLRARGRTLQALVRIGAVRVHAEGPARHEDRAVAGRRAAGSVSTGCTRHRSPPGGFRRAAAALTPPGQAEPCR